MVTIYSCPRCGTKYLERDLTYTTCSENYCGTYTIGYCPKCFNKRKNKQIVKLEANHDS